MSWGHKVWTSISEVYKAVGQCPEVHKPRGQCTKAPRSRGQGPEAYKSRGQCPEVHKSRSQCTKVPRSRGQCPEVHKSRGQCTKVPRSLGPELSRSLVKVKRSSLVKVLRSGGQCPRSRSGDISEDATFFLVISIISPHDKKSGRMPILFSERCTILYLILIVQQRSVYTAVRRSGFIFTGSVRSWRDSYSQGAN